MREDNDSELPVIDGLGLMRKKDVSNSTRVDPFSENMGELRKSLGGMSTSTKRRTYNQLQKRLQSKDGSVSSKRIDDKEAYSAYDAFEVVQPPYDLDILADTTTISAPHYSAIQAKASNVVGLGFNLVETQTAKSKAEDIQDDEEKLRKFRAKQERHRLELLDMLDNMNSEEDFTEVLIKVWVDYESTGNGYIEIGRKRDGTVGYIGHIPSKTMRIRRKRDGYVQIAAAKVQFFANFQDVIPNPIGDDIPNEVIHIAKYSPISNYYGIPDIVSAQQAVAGNELIARYNLDFFENNAVPRHLITLSGASLSARAKNELMEFFETGLKGNNHRSLFVPLPMGTDKNPVQLKIESIDESVKESSFQNYRKANTSEILMVHRVPITKISVGESVSLAVARDADKTFKEQVCGPQQRMLEKKLNRMMKELTEVFVIKFNEMTLTDEETQSRIDERRIKTGTDTPNEQRIDRGKPAVPGGDKLFDLNAKGNTGNSVRTEETANRERDSERSSGATDSVGEGRNPKGEGKTNGEES